MATPPPEAEPASVNVLLSKTVPSKTNRRHVVTPESDHELMESIRTHGVIQPILVRPIVADCEPLHRLDEAPAYKVGEQIYEVVAGHRRREQSLKAGKTHIPAVIRKLTDEQALEIQNIENIQRQDLDPVDRALAIADLCEVYAKSMGKKEAVEKAAQRLTCKVRTVYNMMSIANLVAEAQAAIRAGDISVSHGYLLGALRPEVQKRALMEGRDYESAPFFSVRELEQWIKTEVYCLLDSAQFKKADANLVPSAGACTRCPKNSEVNPIVAPGAKSPTCTDPACFKAKNQAQAHLVQVQSKPKEPGAVPSRYEKQLYRALHSFEDAGKRWEKLKRRGATDGELLKQIGEELGIDGSSSTIDGWVSYKGGKNPVVWFDAIKRQGKPSLQGKALIDATRKLLEIPQPSAKPNTPQTHAAEDARTAKARADSDRIEERASALLLSTMAGKAKLDNFLIHQIALTFLLDVDGVFDDWDELLGLSSFVQKHLGWPAPKSEAVGYVYGELGKHARQSLPKMKEQKVAALLLMMVVIGRIENKDVLSDLAKRYKVDAKNIRKLAAAELKAEEKGVQTSAQKGKA
jgi:ParB/RepB/Spo0J family partition protein